MAQGRGFSAMILFCCVLVLLSEMADATSFVVGDNNGWSFNTNNWPNGKKFKAGDVLGLSYPPHFALPFLYINQSLSQK